MFPAFAWLPQHPRPGDESVSKLIIKFTCCWIGFSTRDQSCCATRSFKFRCSIIHCKKYI